MNRAGIVGMGLWVPETIRGNDAWPASFVQAFHQQREARRERDFTLIERTTSDRPYDALFVRHAEPHENDPFKGAMFRRVADASIPTAEGDAHACRYALDDAGIDARDVDLLLSSALVQDALVPSNGPAIQDILGCSRAPGIGVEGYCSSALAQLDLAAGLVEAGRARFVLCVQSHQIDRINDPELPSSPIFGDGSAAFVVGRVPDDHGLIRMVRGGDGSLRCAVTHTFKSTPGATWWRDAAGPVVPGTADPVATRRLVRNILAYPIETVRELCAEVGLSADGVDVLSMIQPVAWYQAAVADGLGIALERVPSTYPEYAHLGGASIIANLLAARRSGMLKDGANVVLYAHGTGITRYAALIRWHENQADQSAPAT
jgi:3-oxoacyl-[acyl-carrier-protein] synthase III